MEKMDESISKTAKEPQENNNTLKRKHKQVFPYGNYKNYYGYRIGQGLEEDPRLKVFKKEWFEDKDCLDIGCNSGVITIQIAKNFHCRSILGIDIDNNVSDWGCGVCTLHHRWVYHYSKRVSNIVVPVYWHAYRHRLDILVNELNQPQVQDLIQDAKWNLRQILRKEHSGDTGTKLTKSEIIKKCNGSPCSVSLPSGGTNEATSDDGSASNRNLSHVVSFLTEDFTHPEDLSKRKVYPKPKKFYDTILCLSVAKWIHLNEGDDGLITLFSRIWELLHPGGILIFEPQPWKSYESNRRVSEITAKNFSEIKLKPDCFIEILLEKIGFRNFEDITSGLSGSTKGFDRPIFVFHK